MQNINLNPGGFIGAALGVALPGALFGLGALPDMPDYVLYKLSVAGFFGGVYGGNQLWTQLWGKQPPEGAELADLEPPSVPVVPQRSVWPRIIGIGMIVLAAFSLFWAALYLAAVALLPWNLPGANNDDNWWLIAFLVFGMTVTVLMLLAGIQLSTYKRSGIAATRLWAVASLVSTGAFAAFSVGLGTQRYQGEAIVAVVVATLVGVVAYSIMPITCLIYFACAKPYEPNDA